ncbi:MAG: bifunctional hydroxymethylpyrimidine kinase/phosphomethylpyrimidine kinase [Bryobacteraceae bacterium]
MPAIALSIAGSDPSGGAGIQADLKTFTQFGAYGEAAITLLTVQNTRGVSRVEILPTDLVVQQIEAVLADIPPTAAKTGALGSVEIVEAVAELTVSFAFPLVVDPVMISKHGARLLSHDAEETLKRKLLPRAFLVTPNIPEAEALTGITIRDQEDVKEAAARILDFGCAAVLIKGGHLAGPPDDLLLSGGESTVYAGKRVNTTSTHGAGCTYSAAITASLALGLGLKDACGRAKQYIQHAIETAPSLGHGNGPLNHFVN